MAMRVSGINSGLDTDSIVQELVSAYSQKTEKYEKEQTKLSWKQEIWSTLNSKVYSLYTSISSLRYSSAYSLKKTTSSDTTKATVSASGSAVNGTQKLNILQTAESGYLTGAKVKTTTGASATSETKLSELGFTDEDGAIFCLKTTDDDGNEVTKELKFTKNSTIADVTSALSEAGLTASFDENNGRFYISSSKSGSAGDFSITFAETKTTVAMEEVTDEDGNTSNEIVKDENGDVVYEETKLSAAEQQASKRLLNALGLESMESQTSGAVADKQGNTAKTTSTMGNLGWSGSTTITVSYTDLADPVDEDGNAKTKTATIEISSYSTRISDILDQFNEQGISASFDGSTGQFTFLGVDNMEFSAKTADGEEDTQGTELIKKLGLDQTTDSQTDSSIKIDGQDAVIVLNGVMYTSDSNNFSINGLNITANGVTDDVDTVLADYEVDSLDKLDSKKLAALQKAGNAITISTSTDTQGLYDKVKDFLTQYNSIINEITKLYNADSAYGYEPLTDDEKDAMSDTEIEKWETKIKDSLLRRDTSLSSLMSSMINAMSQSITINGQKYSLSSFGIQTLGYLNAVENEQNAYHIDGDEEDENTSGNEDKLMAAITSDPDTVVEFMKQLATNLYTAIDNNMQSSSLRSRYKIYNDKEMDTQYNNYTTLISDWEDKVADKEEYYYNKFTQMETALGKLNSQTSSLSSLFGS